MASLIEKVEVMGSVEIHVIWKQQDEYDRILCNLRRSAVADAFPNGRPAEQNGHIPHLNFSVNGKG